MDSDGDGINDIVDNCDDTVNPNQEDYDFDGYGDICDDNKFCEGFDNFEWKDTQGQTFSMEDYGRGWYPIFGYITLESL